jgi:hypothetical protein
LTKFEIWKLAISALIPLSVVFLGCLVGRYSKRYDERVRLHGKIIEKRVELFEEISQPLNVIYTYIIRVGSWKEHTPYDIIQEKREVDGLMYSNRPYWTEVLFSTYESFMNASFETHTGHASDAKIKSDYNKYKDLPNWSDSYIEAFSGKVDKKQLNKTNEKLMQVFAQEFGFVQKKA